MIVILLMIFVIYYQINLKKLIFLVNKNYLKRSLFKKIIFLNITLILNIFRKKELESNKPKIFQEYKENIFDRYPEAGHLFWLNQRKINFSEIGWFFLSKKCQIIISLIQ